MNRNKLQVLHRGRMVGTLAYAGNRCAAFQYSREWLADGFALNPFSLPLSNKVFVPKYEPLGGLFGVFADSLPDGWGRLLVDRLMLAKGLDPHSVGQLERLAIVADSGMGSLEYVPAWNFALPQARLDLDALAAECRAVLNDEACDDLDELFRLGGSSGGARPKVLTKLDGGDWLIKFPAQGDRADIGRQEYEYACCAAACGLEMPEVRLFPSRLNQGYFGTRRFDRTADGKVFMASAAALLETSHRVPNLDYDILMQLTRLLCRDQRELEKLYRLMCFNVYAHNRDDHAKNFTFLYDEQKRGWRLSPAYDLTYSYSLQGEHATTVHGNGVNPGLPDLLAVAKQAGLRPNWAQETAGQIAACVKERLGAWLSKDKGV